MCLCAFGTGCATMTLAKPKPRQLASSPKRAPLSAQERQKIALLAKQSLGKSRLKVGSTVFRNDCSGAVRGIFAKANIPLGGVIKNQRENDVKAIYRYTQKYGKIVQQNPQVGDIVFFHNTYDRSRNGKMNDALTHIGIVEKVEGPVVHFIHHLGQSIIRSRMDLSRPNLCFESGSNKRINHILRKAQGKYRAYTTAELFAGFGQL